MSFKKQMLTLAAVGAVTAATAVPATALENEFHGSYKLKYFVSNADQGGSGQILPIAASNKVGFNSGVTAANYFEQRARILYTAKANNDLKLVTGFEIDSVFGDKTQGALTADATINTTAFRNSGGALDSDAVNLETKWVYLDFNIPSTPLNVKAGIQAYKDPFKGIFLDADAAGLYTTAKIGDAALGLGYFRAYEALAISTSGSTAGQITGSPVSPRGTDNFDIAVLEGKYNLSKSLTVGGAYFLYSDYRSTLPTTFHTFGLNAEGKVGPATISGFAAYQTGFSRQDTNGLVASKGSRISGFAANLAAKSKVGPGTARLAALYTSGDHDTKDGVDHSWQGVNTTKYAATPSAANPYPSIVGGGSVNSYSESNMMLLNRTLALGGSTTDRELIATNNNVGQGSIIVAAGYDFPITPKAYTNVNAGAAFTAQNNQNSPQATTQKSPNGSQYMGTELNVEAGYKIYDNLTASIQAAYVFLGGYYDGAAGNSTATRPSDPANPYTTRLALTYIF